MDPSSLPAPPYCRLYGRLVLPDVTPGGGPHAPRGTITIRPVPPRVTYQDASGQSRVVASQTVCQIDSEGYLTSDGHRWVDLVAPGAGVVPSGTWLYRVEIIADSRLDIHTITLSQGQAVDLAHSIAAATVVDPPTAAASAIAAAQSAAASARAASAAAEAARVSSDAAVRALAGTAPTPSGGGGSAPTPSPDAPTRQDLDALRARVEQIASQAPSGPDLALTTRVTTVETSMEGLRATISQAQAASQAASQATQTASTTETALAAVRESVAKNQQSISALTTRVDALPTGGTTPTPSPDAPTRQDLEALRAKINALEGAATSGGTPTQRVDMSTTHTYTLAEGVPMQVVLVTKSAAGMASLEHPAGVTWPLGVPSLTSEVGQQVHLIFIRVAAGWLGYAAGDLDDIDQVLASLPPMRAVLPKFMDNGWADTGWLAICNTVADSDGIRTIRVTRNVQKKLPDNKRGNSEWWNFLQDVSPEQAAKTKSGDLLLIGTNQLALNKPFVVSGTIGADELRTNFGIYAVPYNETLAAISVYPDGTYVFTANGAGIVNSTVKANSGDSLRLKFDGTKCSAYLMPAGQKTWSMLGTLAVKSFSHAETSVQPRINNRSDFTVSNWMVAGETA
nr:MAG TPA: hypothetical protein [Caudoviricetes sp.]